LARREKKRRREKTKNTGKEDLPEESAVTEY
jgi:hypothetical protein